ncbi:MAG: hypothetical protein ABI237_10970 [Ginsengibacter sp.]
MNRKVSMDPNADMGDYIFVKANNKLNKIVYASILYVESLKDFVKIFTIGEAQPFITYSRLKSIEEKSPLHSCL